LEYSVNRYLFFPVAAQKKRGTNHRPACASHLNRISTGFYLVKSLDGTGTNPGFSVSEDFGAAGSVADSGAFSVLDVPFELSFFGGAGVGVCGAKVVVGELGVVIVADGAETPVSGTVTPSGSPQGPIGSR
jgi:hypothetical protein